VPLQAGEKVDRYRILGALGAGGMGEVYRARDTRLERDVALKILQPAPDGSGHDSSTGGAARMLREARAAAALEHPNVVAVYDVGTIEEPAELRGSPYIAMELIRGKSLRSFVGDAAVPMAERVRWVADAARALGAAHKAGLVHRDIKPENVMVRDDGVVKVLDFGIAKRWQQETAIDPTSSTEAQVLPSVTTKGIVVGTPYYMAPEQMRSEPLDGRADQFSWGVLAYELLAGKAPWRLQGDALQLVSEILSADPPPPNEVNPQVSGELALVVMRALAKSREKRFATMEDLVAALSSRRASIPGGVSSPAAFAPTLSGIPASGMASPTPPAAPSPPLHPDPAHSPTKGRHQRLWFVAVAGVALLVPISLAARRWVTNRGDVAATASGTASGASAPGACHTSVECAQKLGEPAVCHADDGRCVALSSEDCKVLAPKDSSPDTIWIGAMFPLTTQPWAHGDSDAEAVDLARRDFEETMGALGSSAQVTARPFGVISCDNGVDAARAAHHLVDDARVPAIITGFGWSRDLVEAAGSAFASRGVLAVETINTSPLIATLPHPAGQPRLLWRTTFNAAQMELAVAALVPDLLEPRIRTLSRLPPESPVRVVVLRVETAGQRAMSDILFSALRFNGKSALDNAGDYRELVFDPDSPQEAQVRMLVDLAPHIVVTSGSIGQERPDLERAWPADRAWRPTYVTTNPISDEDLRWIGKDKDRRHRLFGINTSSNTPANARLVMHYNQAFHANLARDDSPNTAYDAFYVIAYARYALGDHQVSGRALASVIPHLLPPGKPIEVGPGQIFEAYNALRAGENIDLTGATGRLDFDPETGEAPTDQVILCAGVDAAGNATEGIESGLVYDATAKKLVGQMKCP
jgi:serine/threonine-protein kinase